MSGFLDTSLIVRYLTGDPHHLAVTAAKIIDNEDNLQITDAVIAETAHVLSSVYQTPRETIVDYLITLLQKSNISTFGIDKNQVLHALLLCRPSGRVSFPDAMLWAVATSSNIRLVYSMDKRFPRGGIDVRSSL